MLGFSIMMWFVSFVILMVAIALLRGNVSVVHGKVFDETEDKVGYAKQIGRLCLFLSIGLGGSGAAAVLVKGGMALFYALGLLLIVVAISAIWAVVIQRKFR